MTIDSKRNDIKGFFKIPLLLILFLFSHQGRADDAVLINNFDELREFKGEALRKTSTGGEVAKQSQGLKLEVVAEKTLKQLKSELEAFKKANPSWISGDTLLQKLGQKKEFDRLQQKFVQLLTQILARELTYDPETHLPFYFVIPRIIIDFREKFSDELDRQKPELKEGILKRLNRTIFKEGNKQYLAELDRRFKYAFADPRPGDASILGKIYAPGNTYYSESYRVEANFTLLDQPYNLISSVLLKFLIQEDEFKAPFGILVRDLKRIFPRTLDDFRLEIQERLMTLFKELDPDTSVLLIQQFIPKDEVPSVAYLEYFGLGYPVYVDAKGTVKFQRNPSILSGDDKLLSPIDYRNAFTTKEGKPETYHKVKGLPDRKDMLHPIYPVRLKFDLNAFNDYYAYAFPGEGMQDYTKKLAKIIEDMIAKLSSLSPEDQKDINAKDDETTSEKDQEKKMDSTSSDTKKKDNKKESGIGSVVGNALKGKGDQKDSIAKAISKVVSQATKK